MRERGNRERRSCFFSLDLCPSLVCSFFFPALILLFALKKRERTTITCFLILLVTQNTTQNYYIFYIRKRESWCCCCCCCGGGGGGRKKRGKERERRKRDGQRWKKDREKTKTSQTWHFSQPPSPRNSSLLAHHREIKKRDQNSRSAPVESFGVFLFSFFPKLALSLIFFSAAARRRFRFFRSPL